MDDDFSDPIIDLATEDPVFLPDAAFVSGNYYWRWGSELDWAPPFSFRIDNSAVSLEIPKASVWLERTPDSHPRLYITEASQASFRDMLNGERQPEFKTLIEGAESVLEEPHTIREPDFLPDRNLDYPGFWESVVSNDVGDTALREGGGNTRTCVSGNWRCPIRPCGLRADGLRCGVGSEGVKLPWP